MKIKILKALVQAGGVAALLCGLTMPAQAVTFSFSQSTGFLVGTTGNLKSSDASSPNNDISWYQASNTVAPPSGLYNTIGWGGNRDNNGGLLSGNGNNPMTLDNSWSGLQVLGQAGSVALDTWVTITKLAHNNDPITGATLASATISSILSIGVTPSITNGIIDFNDIPITFNETANTSGGCVAGSPGGVPCPDYFGFNAVGSGGIYGGFSPVTFAYGGMDYKVLFQLHNISAALIEEIGTSGDIRIWTHENQTSTMDVQMMITQVVPEPSGIALLGIALLGLYGTRRGMMSGTKLDS